MKRFFYLSLLLALVPALSARAGKVVTDSLQSKILGAQVKYNVYLPDGFDKSEQLYPVVYLLHGLYGTYEDWEKTGRMKLVTDELISSGEASQMVIIMPNAGHPDVRNEWNGYFNMPGWNYEDFFFQELIPTAEKKYRIVGDKGHRAIMGLSMGGGQSFYIGLRDPDVFANVGVFSTGMFGGISGASNFDLETEVPGILSDTKTFNKQFDVFFLSCGEQDPRIQYTRTIVQKMRDGGVDVRFNSYPGDHEWQVWRKSLHEFAQYLFK